MPQFCSLKILETKGGMMLYHINANAISLGDLERRIETTDLVPSRTSLLNELNIKMNQLQKQGIGNLTELRIALKTKKRLKRLPKRPASTKNT